MSHSTLMPMVFFLQDDDDDNQGGDDDDGDVSSLFRGVQISLK